MMSFVCDVLFFYVYTVDVIVFVYFIDQFVYFVKNSLFGYCFILGIFFGSKGFFVLLLFFWIIKYFFWVWLSTSELVFPLLLYSFSVESFINIEFVIFVCVCWVYVGHKVSVGVQVFSRNLVISLLVFIMYVCALCLIHFSFFSGFFLEFS